MTFLYPFTHRQWLKNKENGFPNYVQFEVGNATKRISRTLTFFQKNQNTFITESDIVNVNIKRNVYKNALTKKIVFLAVFIALVIAESTINYENMEIFILPGDESLRALLMRSFTALIVTLASIVLADLSLEMIFHSWFERDKVRYNFPDAMNTSFSEKVWKTDKTRMVFLVLCLAILAGCLWTIYLFSEKRAAILNAITQPNGDSSGNSISPLTLVALILPFLGAISMLIVKINHNIVIAYRSMVRYKTIEYSDKNRKNSLLDAFTIRRAKTLNQEVATSFRKVVKFKNYLEAQNKKLKKGSIVQDPYKTHEPSHTGDQNMYKKFIISRLEPETLRYFDQVVPN